MDCLITKLKETVNNDNLPFLAVERYMDALGDSSYRSAISDLYNTLYETELINDFDVIMPVLGETVSKVMMNLLNAKKHLAYNDAIQVGSNSMYATENGNVVNGSYESDNITVPYTFIAVFKRDSTKVGKILTAANVSSPMATENGNFYSVEGGWVEYPTGESGNVYLLTTFTSPYGGDPQNKYNIGRNIGTNLATYVQATNKSYNPAQTVQAPLVIQARTELLFFAIMNKRITDSEADVILPAIKTFVEATKDVTFAPNPSVE